MGGKCLGGCKSYCVCRSELKDLGWLSLDNRRLRKFEAGEGHIQVTATIISCIH